MSLDSELACPAEAAFLCLQQVQEVWWGLYQYIHVPFSGYKNARAQPLHVAAQVNDPRLHLVVGALLLNPGSVVDVPVDVWEDVLLCLRVALAASHANEKRILAHAILCRWVASG